MGNEKHKHHSIEVRLIKNERKNLPLMITC